MELGCLSVCVQYTSFCQSAGWGIKSHLVTTLVILQVKKAMAMVVVAMGHHSYLELEGGTQMVEFIVAQCALADDPQVGKHFPK